MFKLTLFFGVSTKWEKNWCVLKSYVDFKTHQFFSHLDETQKNYGNLKIAEFFVQILKGHFFRDTLTTTTTTPNCIITLMQP